MLIGLTGGLGAGKSTVGEMLRRRGVHLIKADEVGHRLLEREEVRGDLVSRLGRGILNERGEVDRGRLAELAFTDPEALRRLEELLHPLIWAEIEREVAARRRLDPRAHVAVEAALLFEAGWADRFDLVVVVHAPLEIRLERARRCGRTLVEARARRQLAEEERLRRADFVIDNGGDLRETERQVERLLERLSLRRCP